MTDFDKIAGIILDDFRSGRIGRITLEKPGEETQSRKKKNLP